MIRVTLQPRHALATVWRRWSRRVRIAVMDPQPRWTVGAVARRLGMAPATLRTWDRRYGLGPTDHASGAHRRYTEADVERLARMAAMLRRGLSTAEAARLVTAGQETPAPADEPPSTLGESPRTRTVEDTLRWRRGVTKAALALDSASVLARVSAAIEEYGVIEAWDLLLRPVLVEAGLRWATTGAGVDVEHMLSDCVTSALHPIVAAAPPPRQPGRSVLLACAADDNHDLPLHVLRAALVARRVPVQLLGAATPGPALASAAERIGPAAVLIWSQLPVTADASLFGGIPPMRPRITCFAGGPGWQRVELPPAVGRLATLGEAVSDLVMAAGVAAPAVPLEAV